MDTTSIYSILLLLAILIFCIGGALVEYADDLPAPNPVGFAGVSLLVLSLALGFTVLALWVGPVWIDGLNTLSCWREHSINYCLVDRR